MKKKLIIIISIVLILIISLIGIYLYGLKPVSDKKELVLYTLNSGTSKLEVIEELKSANLIRSKFSSTIYITLHRNLNLQAGTYELSENMSIKDILKKFDEGKIKEEKNTFNLTFIEGKRLVDYAEIIADATNTALDEVLNILNDKEYLNELINKYWFITDEILKSGIYYPLEGYLYPSTYEFYKNSTVKEIVEIMIDTLGSKLKNYEEDINNKNMTIHEFLTMASVVELEGANSNDRAGIAGVFYNRLKSGDALGSDVTTYYAARKTFDKELKMSELDNCNNGYNTRGGCNAGKLPIGPICSPSIASIEASINPEEHNYYFFVADKYKKTYFTKTNAEHNAKVAELKANGLWYDFK